MRWVLFVLLLPLLLLGALATPWGLRAAVGLGTGFVPGLSVDGVSGQLPGRLAVGRLRLTDAQGVWLEITDAEVALAWRDLFDRRVTLTGLRVGRLMVDRAAVTAPASAEPVPLAIPSLPRLPLALAIEALEFDRIELGAALLGTPVILALRGALALDSAGMRGALDARRLDQPGTATLNLALGADRLEATLDVAEPAQGIVATLAGLPQAPFTARLSISGPAADAQWQARGDLGEAQARLGGQVGLQDGAVTLTLDGRVAGGALLPAEYRALAANIIPGLTLRRRADGALAIERLDIASAAGRLTAEGTLGTDQRIRARYRLEPTAPEVFGALLPAGLGWRAVTAEGEISGPMAAPDVTTRIRIDAPRGAGAADALLGDAVTLAASLRGGVVEARLQGARLAATLRGRAATALDLTFTAEFRDAPGTTGTISAEGEITGTPLAPVIQARVTTPLLAAQGRVVAALRLDARATPTQLTVQGEARIDGRPLAIEAEAGRDGDAIRLSRLQARFAGIAIEAQAAATLPGPVTGHLTLNAPDLAPLGLGLAGRLAARIEGRAITGAQGPAAQGLRLSIEGTGVGAGAFRPAVQAEIDGTLAALGFRFGLRAPQGTLDVAGRTTQGDDTTITLTRFDGRAGPDALRLAAPTTIRVAPDGRITLPGARLVSQRGGSLAVQGSLADGQINGRADIAALPLLPFSAGAVAGTLTGQVLASGPAAAPQARATLRIEGLRATDPALAGLPAAQVQATASLAGRALRAEARIAAGPAVALTIEAAQPAGPGLDAPFTAAARGQLDLGTLARPFLAGGADRVAGRLRLDLRASGTPAAPVLAGSASLSDGSYANPITGVRLDGITAQFVARGERLVVDTLVGRTLGGGTITGQGWIEPLGAGIPAELRLTARNARPVTGEFGEATLDADLALRGPLTNGGSLAGRVTISRAELRIPETLGASIPTLGQVREVGPLPPGRRPPAAPRRAAPTTTTTTTTLPMALDLVLAAPRAVFLRGRGLEAELGGEITIRGTAAAPIPSGAFRLRRGSFDLVGRQLQFSRGVITFEGGSFNPTLDFLATARSRSNTINLNVKGTPARPELTVTAEPELPQDEALARLLFDRETTRLSPFELAGIAQAVAQLAGVLPAGSGVLDRLRTAAGLDRLGVTGDGRSGAAVEAGRYVAPGVFVGVRQGTSGGAPGVGVQVELTPRLRLEGQTQTGAAGDRLGITYEYEY